MSAETVAANYLLGTLALTVLLLLGLLVCIIRAWIDGKDKADE